MSTLLDNVAEQALGQLTDSPIKNLLGEVLKSSLDKQQESLNELLAAKEEGQITQEEFDIELAREKEILEAEMLTKEITAKAEVQKLVNQAIKMLSKGLI